LPARNTLVQLLDLCTNPESHNAQRYRQTDGRWRTDDMMMPIAAKNDNCFSLYLVTWEQLSSNKL